MQNSPVRDQMAIVTSDNLQFGTVDHLDGSDLIKMTKDNDGKHHWIPLSWVETVDDKVHLTKTGQQAMREWSETEPGSGEGATGTTQYSTQDSSPN